ncbi:MAG: S9 family peptidase [Actinomycetota bacterium]|nr:S9 family peptidase [Actinomycetota bacterium]
MRPASIPVEEVARLPAPGMAVPVKFAFSPDDDMVTFLHDAGGGLVRQLYFLEVATGERGLLAAPSPEQAVDEEGIPLEEALRRERRRELGLGITRYEWARHAGRLLMPLQDGVYVQEQAGGRVRKVVGDDDGPVLDPSLSPDGAMVAFVRDGEVHVTSAEGGPPRQLTHGARGTGRTHGLAEFVAQEEMDRSSGYWWSRDGAWLAFTEVDETHIPAYRIVHQGSDEVGEGAYEDHRYPFAGAANARVRLGVVATAGGEARWLDLSVGPDLDAAWDWYLARVRWMPDGTVVAQVEDRRQARLDLLRFDPESGRRQELLAETSDVWLNLHDLFHPLERTREAEGGFVWGSERTGFRHLYLCDGGGAVVRPLTVGPWMVDSLDGVDEEAGLVYFSATLDGPRERHLYSVPLAGGEPRRVSLDAGVHHVVLDHRCRRFVDVHSAARRQPTVTLRSLSDGEVVHVIHDEPDERVERLGLTPPEQVSLTTRDGAVLHGMVHRPSSGTAPYPAIVSVYGGPHVQRATDSWLATADMRAQHLRSLGYVVFVLDNRGSAGRGLDFEAAIRHDLGNVEVKDQVDGVSWLVDQGLADPDRIGIYGWSYGGYLAAMCLARAPGVFAAAVAGAPVTHWDGYDTHYAERYMATPASNPEGYVRSSVMSHVDDMAGELLLVHGLLDENVHFRHTARLVSALVRARKRFELLMLPEERHLPRKAEDRVYVEERVRDFFRAHL